MTTPNSNWKIRCHASPRAQRRGFSALWTTITLVLVITLTGVGIDSGHLFLSAQQLQNAADASAIAGARLVRESTEAARTDAVRIGEANSVAGATLVMASNPNNEPDGDVVIGRYNRETGQFTVTLTAANAVMVRARRTANSGGGRVPLLFGAVVGLAGVDMERTAIAMNSGGTGAGLIALAPSGCGLQMGGNVALHVDGGDIQINSASNCAVCTNGGPTINSDAINVAGNVCLSGNTVFDGVVNSGSPPLPDPLAFLPAPPIGPPMNPPGVSLNGGNMNLMPGYYPDGIRMTGGTLDLAPGIYIVGGGGGGGQYPPGLSINGGVFNAEGVTIYVLDGAVDIGGNGVLNLTPPNPEQHSFNGAETYEHVSIFQARTNTRQSRIIGTGAMNLKGTLYFPKNHVNLGGTSSGVGEQLIADTLSLSGNGDITINYQGNFNAAGSSVFLVR